MAAKTISGSMRGSSSLRKTAHSLGLAILVLTVYMAVVDDVEAQDCNSTSPIGAANDEGHAIAIQPDGKIVVAGWFDNGTDDDIFVRRYNSDFSPDTSFDTDGLVTTDIGGMDAVRAVAIQSDGKIVVAGSTDAFGTDDVLVVRYNPDGSLDTSFDTDGIVTTPIGGSSDVGQGVVIQPDGKIAVTGNYLTGNWNILLVRYNTDGSLDTSFDGDGIVTTDITASSDYGYGIDIQTDNKLVVAGTAAGDFAAVRYNTDGSLDTSFDGDGVATADIGGTDTAKSIAIQTDGKIVVAGNGQPSGYDFTAVRYNTDGSLDTSFDSDGIVTTPIGVGTDICQDVAIQSDGKIVLSGYTSSPFDFALARYNTDGSLDTSFDGDGIVTTENGGTDVNHALAIDSNGAIIIAGYTNSTTEDVSVIRYDPDGSVAGYCYTTNWRSIGTDSGILYNFGNASITAGTNTVTFGGLASLPSNIGTGDELVIDAEPFYILSRDSSSQVTVQTGALSTHTNGAYNITRAYTTLQAWETDRQGDLVGANRREVGVAYDDSDFTSGIDISGSTTDAARFMWLTVASGQRHNGTPGSGVILDGGGVMTETVTLLDDYTRFEWFEVHNYDGAAGNVVDIRAQNVFVSHLIVHDFPFANLDGISIRSAAGTWSMTVQNCLVYNGGGSGIQGDNSDDTVTVENCTVYGCDYGVHEDAGSVITVRNTIAMNCVPDINVPSGVQSNNLSSDNTASGPLINKLPDDIFVNPGTDFHLKSGVNEAVDAGLDLSSSFWSDIDGQSRIGQAWDIGADERDAPTAVSLTSFDAIGYDAGVLLEWETGSETDNLGFNVYRSMSEDGPYTGVTSMPGLGSSPEGAKYSYNDSGLTNGVTYYYKLEDIETTGKTEMHGPVAATPQSGAASCCGEEDSRGSRITVGRPSQPSLNFLETHRDGVVLELTTGGFYAEPQPDGTVRLDIPGFELTSDSGYPSLPVRRTWVEVLAGRKVQVVSIESFEEERFAGLKPWNAGEPLVQANQRGTVRATRTRRARKMRSISRVHPAEAARVLSVGFQGDVKKALVELAPLRWDPRAGHLLLAHRLVVRLAFRGRDSADGIRGGSRARRYTKRASHVKREVVARLVTEEPGLYGVDFDEVLGGNRGARMSSLRLSRQGRSVAFHVEPNDGWFRRGSRLYFVSEGSESNPYGQEAVYELEVGTSGLPMAVGAAAPSGEATKRYWATLEEEVDLLYQSTLVEAPDRWLWSTLFAPELKSFPFELSALAPTGEASGFTVWLQGASDFAADPDHHVRLAVNGIFVGEVSWDGKQPQKIEVELVAGVLQEGANSLEIENVGDTGASYSMVFLDRFQVVYPRLPVATEGRLEGRWSESGIVDAVGLGPGTVVLEMGPTGPVWLEGAERMEGGIQFGVEVGQSYLAVSPEAVRKVTEVRRPEKSRLKLTRNRADYLALGPRSFLDAARPLLELRASQGLRVKAVAWEEVVSEFGFGEESPMAIRDFLSYAYHHWSGSPRYVVLLGDATFDFKDRLGTGTKNHVPPLMVMTTYLETASDPAYVSVNGEDVLPDLAIGRLPAATLEELERMVSKIVSWETSGRSLEGRVVLVADNPDGGGDFVTDAEELSATVLSTSELKKIYLSRLGTSATRSEISSAFNEGVSLMSYIGHGGIHLWADENIFNIHDVPYLYPQPTQPMLLTMNCLNGYFHFPFFASLAEELLKAEDKGVIAAFSPSGLSLNVPAHVYHKALLEEIVERDHERLGDAILAAQAAYAEAGAFPELLIIYHLFGDPALELR